MEAVMAGPSTQVIMPAFCLTNQFSLLQVLTCWCNKASDGMSTPPPWRFSRRQREKTTASVASERPRIKAMALLLPSTCSSSHRACSPRNLLQDRCSPSVVSVPEGGGRSRARVGGRLASSPSRRGNQSGRLWRILARVGILEKRVPCSFFYLYAFVCDRTPYFRRSLLLRAGLAP